MLSDQSNVHGAASDQRDWSRTAPAESRVCLLTEAGSKAATIIDEAFGGVGLLVQTAEKFTEGQEVGLAYGGISMRAITRWSRGVDEGQQHIGLEWLDERRESKAERRSALRMSQSPHKQERRTGSKDRRSVAVALQEAAAHRTARLVSIGGLPVLCGLIEERTDGTATVQLPGGVQHDVQLQDLRCSSLLERRTQLESLDRELSILVGIYELGNPQTKSEAIEAVLEYEFSEDAA